MKQAQVDYRKPDNWPRPLKAIRLKCIECCAGSAKLVRECHIFGCSLWPYRMGKRPETGGDSLYDSPDPKVWEIDDPEEATAYAGGVPVSDQ